VSGGGGVAAAGRGTRGAEGGLRAQKIAVVLCFLLRRTEDRVRFGDLDEPFRRGWVVGVEVRVVGFGKLVELPVGCTMSVLRL